MRVHEPFAGGMLSIACPNEANRSTIIPRQRTIWIPIDSFEKPLNHVHVLSLRRIEPPIHGECRIIVLSGANNRSGTEKVFLESKYCDSAGTIYLWQKSDQYARRHAEDEKGWTKIH